MCHTSRGGERNWTNQITLEMVDRLPLLPAPHILNAAGHQAPSIQIANATSPISWIVCQCQLHEIGDLIGEGRLESNEAIMGGSRRWVWWRSCEQTWGQFYVGEWGKNGLAGMESSSPPCSPWQTTSYLCLPPNGMVKPRPPWPSTARLEGADAPSSPCRPRVLRSRLARQGEC
jgi:hypothetical protein